MSITSHFTDHPRSVDETYFEHMNFAGGYGLHLIAAGCAAMIHAVLPFAFERTASAAVAALHQHAHGRNPDLT